jgi:hypothetical protein
MSYIPGPAESVWEAENTFYLRSDVSRLGKLLAHYEIYKRIVDLPGAILELGVYKGASLVRFASFRQLLENDFSRAIHGFDAFGAFPTDKIAGGPDLAFIERFEGAGGEGISRDLLAEIVASKNIRNVHLHAGNVFDTIPAFLEREPALKIALLHLDMDVYEPTAFALDQLAERMVRGGIVLFDDYTSVEGATRAGDEFAAKHGLRFEKLSNYYVPSFVVMP